MLEYITRFVIVLFIVFFISVEGICNNLNCFQKYTLQANKNVFVIIRSSDSKHDKTCF